jgi:hypothetical protein
MLLFTIDLIHMYCLCVDKRKIGIGTKTIETQHNLIVGLSIFLNAARRLRNFYLAVPLQSLA